MRLFFDLSRLDIVTEKEMASKFAEDKTFGGSFPAYLENCLAENGGDLKEITSATIQALQERMRSFGAPACGGAGSGTAAD